MRRGLVAGGLDVCLGLAGCGVTTQDAPQPLSPTSDTVAPTPTTTQRPDTATPIRPVLPSWPTATPTPATPPAVTATGGTGS